jgi:hypothetical protein
LKIYRLGRQIVAEIISPITILAGAIHNYGPQENVPATTP